VETLVGIAFGPPWIKVNVDITKNRKMVSRHYLELGMRYCNQTWYGQKDNLCFGEQAEKVG
jgi:hypothetical protein